jgi:hypothetical protein
MDVNRLPIHHYPARDRLTVDGARSPADVSRQRTVIGRAFDPTTGSNSVVFDYGTVLSGAMGLGIDTNLNLLATIAQNDSPDTVRMFQLTGNSSPPVMFHQALMSDNANVNGNAGIAMKNKRLYALEVNNGILALSYNTPVATANAANFGAVTSAQDSRQIQLGLRYAF